MTKKMNLYLVDCLCKSENSTWKFASVVKAQSPIYAWNKFLYKWNEDLQNGSADVPTNVIIEFKVEKLCQEKEAIL